MGLLAADSLSLPQKEVHVWQWSLAVTPEDLTSMALILSPEERERADRFHFEKHRRRFVVARSTLKTLLGRYLNLEPAAISLALGDRGKPFIPTHHNNLVNLQFNLSHSHELAVAGFACNRAVGIDLEQIRSVEGAEAMARRFFSPTEYEGIADLPPAMQSRAFLALWTAKEAFLKGMGLGIGGGLDTIEIRSSFGDRLNFHPIDPPSMPERPWQLISLDLGEDYLGALAVEGEPVDVRSGRVERTRAEF
jgi:4'-phosphopantetheinyl transferase